MKEFDLEKAKAGHPVCTRNGRPARIICWDARSNYPVVALVDREDYECMEEYTLKGRYVLGNMKSDKDLMLADVKHEGWVNLYEDVDEISCSNVYKSKADAVANIDKEYKFIATAKIEWEE